MQQRLDSVQALPCSGVRVWWQPLQPVAGQLDLVVSNPPYVPSAVVDGLEPVVRDHEPRLALDGGSDGLDALRSIIEAAPSMLAPGGGWC